MKIYVGWFEGDYGSSGYVAITGLDRFKLVKYAIEKKRYQNMDIKVYDSETMEEISYCDCLHQYTEKNRWCNCQDCKSNDETVRYLVATKQGNYHK